MTIIARGKKGNGNEFLGWRSLCTILCISIPDSIKSITANIWNSYISNNEKNKMTSALTFSDISVA